MNKLFDRLYFIGPMSLGDHFVFNGISHYYGDRTDELHLPCLPCYYDTVSCLYQDYPNIKVVPIAVEEEESYVKTHNLSVIKRVPMQHTIVRGVDIHPVWDMQVYANYELPFGMRYTNFRLPNKINGAEELYWKLTNGLPYILIHRYTGDHPNGIPIDVDGYRIGLGLPELLTIEIDQNIAANMMQLMTLIERANEIHVVPSSVHCLVDSVKTNAKLFFHDVREKTSMAVNSAWNGNKWNILHYPHRL